ncbi:beta-lactamase-like protein [Entophlyctis helioformis]|nr:beta-lactamase-like protein [Entophlyctis helioformis]
MGRLKEFIFLGTGTSGSVPNIHCLIEEPAPTCKVCLSAIQYEPQPKPAGSGEPVLQLPHFSKNRRRNTSGLLRFMHSDGRMRNVLLDCGKTFYDAALTWFVEYRLRKIDAVLLTHGHADAMMGLDELRQWTIGGETKSVQDVVHVYLGPETMEVVARAFPYMVDKKRATGGGDVPTVQFHVIEFGPSGPLPFVLEDELEITPFEVEHGKNGAEPYYAFGFRAENFTYVSDANCVPPAAAQIIKGSKFMVVDALRPDPHVSHFSFTQAIEVCLYSLEPGGHGFFTGLTHAVDHDDVNKLIENDGRAAQAGIHVQCGFDGQRIVIDL